MQINPRRLILELVCPEYISESLKLCDAHFEALQISNGKMLLLY
jgi:hypothetical protein